MAAVMFLRKAMRYYRLWIYTCNAVLLVSVFVFMGVALGVASHPYLSLVPSPPAYHPTLLYGYVALLLQAGVLQALGCVGALRLSQKLLNIYWFLLLFLLLGDVVVGLVWLYRFSHLTVGMRPYARATLRDHYGRDSDVTEAWDALQRAAKCCGVTGPRDYNTTWWENRQNHNSIKLPASCCVKNDSEGTMSGTRQVPVTQADQVPRHVATNHRGKPGIDNSKSHVRLENQGRGVRDRNLTCDSGEDKDYHGTGCAAHLEKWLLTSAETLMILGFCVIAFVKLCFVGILRFEIQEMIQKIKVLQGDNPCVPNPEIAAALGLVSPEKPGECGGLLSSGGGDSNGAGGEEGRGGDTHGDTESGAATPLTQPRLNHLSSHTDGAESDTNSHCALITDTPVRRPQPDKRKPNGNNNDVTELRELRHVRQTQI
ncbi:leukocyte antigen CD37-like [Homarus americanus]|uniref:leukocyte antigen CD37-like n=1 Tax=Homarus americanus TaxID=6706 RepID=UPI001C4753FE|nr:leukocyte antigen CD37-like [Homarus americanus]